ncbi:MAG: 1-(5-phosphoribosyl)-5-amino-4-imidazole-carboxylate carboxylase, partial [Actinobacteria bacterium]|nr:1-(5-phosphoribosyl)-5-amino-4-imidazole-carboxylate carboxylase [Actinomycetota bacterium]
MDVETLRQLMDGVSAGTVSPDEAVERLKRLPFSDVGDALVDHHRHLRQGTP